MKEDDHATNDSTSSNKKLEMYTNKTTSEVSKSELAKAYKVKRWRNDSTPIRGVNQ